MTQEDNQPTKSKPADHPSGEAGADQGAAEAGGEAGGAERTLIVTIDDEGIKRIEAVVADLEALGFVVDQVLEMSGVVVGRYPGALGQLEKVPGILSAEPSERKFSM